MSSRYDSRIEAKIFLLTFSKLNKMTFLNFKLFWWILPIGWYVIIVVYHYLDDGCVFRKANSHFMNHYYKKHYMALIFCAKMFLIEINLAQRRIQGVFEAGLPVRAPKFGAQNIFSGHFLFNGVLWVNLFFNQIRLDVWLYVELRHVYINWKRKGQLLSYFNINKALNTKEHHYKH